MYRGLINMDKALYAHYIKERENAETLEREYGFAIYKLEKDHVYLQDVYVIPSRRGEQLGTALLQEVESIAKVKGLPKMYTSIVPSTQLATNTMKIVLNLGFKIHSSNNDIIFLSREI